MSEALLQWLPPLAQALWAFAWQGVLIGMITAVALHLSRQVAPQWRYAIAGFSLAACPLVFVVTLLLGSSAPEPISVARALGAMRPEDSDPSITWIVPFWLTGVALLLVRLLAGLAQVRRLRQAGVLSAHWQRRAQVLAGALGFARAVELRLVKELDSPICLGWFKPVVLLPVALLTHLPSDQIEALIAHELAHLRRHDYLVNLLQHLVEALLFFHPIVWWLSRRMRQERELIADQIAATATARPRSLAHALAALAQWRAEGELSSVALAAGRGELKGRVLALLACSRDPARASPLRSPFIAAPALAAIAALVPIMPLQAMILTQGAGGPPVVQSEPASRATEEAPQVTSTTWLEQREDALQSMRERIERQQARQQQQLEAQMGERLERWESLGNEITELMESTAIEAGSAAAAQAEARHAALMRESEKLQQEMRQLQQAHEREMSLLQARHQALRE